MRLVTALVSYIETPQPQPVILENVIGVNRGGRKRCWKRLHKRSRQAGYMLLVGALDILIRVGLPQRAQLRYLLGIHLWNANAWAFGWPEPVPCVSSGAFLSPGGLWMPFVSFDAKGALHAWQYQGPSIWSHPSGGMPASLPSSFSIATCCQGVIRATADPKLQDGDKSNVKSDGRKTTWRLQCDA